jgi:hypothetical protein
VFLERLILEVKVGWPRLPVDWKILTVIDLSIVAYWLAKIARTALADAPQPTCHAVGPLVVGGLGGYLYVAFVVLLCVTEFVLLASLNRWAWVFSFASSIITAALHALSGLSGAMLKASELSGFRVGEEAVRARLVASWRLVLLLLVAFAVWRLARRRALASVVAGDDRSDGGPFGPSMIGT